MHAKRETVQVRKLHLSGFKSFVQPTELAIEAGLTGIVGPNGCGKSNLVEALRWVMGESSARGLRGGEMDDVIFAGTGARPAFDLAEVVLHMTASGVRIPGFEDAEELELARRIGRGAGSGYRLNGRELRARDVQLLFADAASGARSAAIVSQGQIGALVEAKPADRRRLLEEAAGIAGLQARRHEAELKLRGAETNLVRLEDLLQTLTEQHEQLAKQARQAKRYGEIGAKLREIEARLLVARWQHATATLDDARAALQTGSDEVAESDRALALMRSERDRHRADLAAHTRTATDLATEAARLAERVAAAESTVRERQLRRRRLEEQRAGDDDELAGARRVVEEAGRKVEHLSGEGAGLERDLAALAEHKEQVTANVEAASGDLARAEIDHRGLVGRHGELQASSGHLARERAQVDQERAGIDAMAGALEDKVRALAGNLPERPDAAGLQAAEAAAAAAERALAEGTARVDAAGQEREAARDALREASERLQAAERAAEERARQRAAAQQARDAVASRRDELDGRRQPLVARREEVAARLEAARAALAGLEIDALERTLGDAEAAALTVAGDVATQRTARDEAAAASDEARERVRELGREIERMSAEAAALAELTAGGDHPSALEAVEVDDGHADALAAALGDDLLAGLDEAAPAHWCGAAGEHKPEPLPEGARPLAELVNGPALLAARLAQVGVVDLNEATQLQEKLRRGQRLVSLEGDLWRWDGFVRRAEALGPVAARLRHGSRRRTLEDTLSAREQALATAEEHQAVRHADAEAATAALAEAERQAAAAAARVRDLERQLGDGRAQAQAREAEARNHGETLDALDREMAELDVSLALARDELAALPAALDLDDDTGDAEVAAARRTLEHAVALEQEAAGRLEAARAELAACRSRSDASRRTLDEARHGVQAAEAACREHAFAEERLAAERAGLDERRAAAGARLAELDRAEAALAESLRSASEALDRSSTVMSGLAEKLAAARRDEQDNLARLQTSRDRLHGVATDLRVWRERGDAALARSIALEERLGTIRDELDDLPVVPEDDAGSEPLRVELARLEAGAAEAEQLRLTEEQRLADLEARLAETETARGLARERMVRAEAEAERAQAALAEALSVLRSRPPPPDLEVAEDVPDPATIARLEEDLARLTSGRERLGAVNLRAVDELRELDLRLTTLQSERDELVQAIERLRRAINALNREGRERLKTAFAEIEKHFEALFVRLFGGGQARLSLTDLEDPLAAGLELAASPPGKKLQSLSLLSGGEKALTALALIFAVFLSRPSPLCILDEVDAPLDDANVERFGNLLDELAGATDTRFVVVTHHPLTMAHMDRLYGVTMLERGVSELVSVDLSRAIELRQTA